MADAVAEFLRSHREDRHDLLITHNFVIAWFVREAFGAPDVAVARRSTRPTAGSRSSRRSRGGRWSLLVHNDLGHLPPELRTGLPEQYGL